MIAEMIALAKILAQAKSFAGLLTQERDRAVALLMQTIGKVHIKTAVKQLMATEHSTEPEKERNNAINNFEVAAEFLRQSLTKKIFLRRLLWGYTKRLQQTYLKITGCHLMIAWLYMSYNNIALASRHAADASEAFERYAAIERNQLVHALLIEFTWNCGGDQQPKTCYVNNRRTWTLLRRFGVEGLLDEDTLPQLAHNIVEAERTALFECLEPLKGGLS